MIGGAAHHIQYARMPTAPISIGACSGLNSSITVQANPSTQTVSNPRYNQLVVPPDEFRPAETEVTEQQNEVLQEVEDDGGNLGQVLAAQSLEADRDDERQVPGGLHGVHRARGRSAQLHHPLIENPDGLQNLRVLRTQAGCFAIRLASHHVAAPPTSATSRTRSKAERSWALPRARFYIRRAPRSTATVSRRCAPTAMCASADRELVLKQRRLEALERARGGLPFPVVDDDVHALPFDVQIARILRCGGVEHREGRSAGARLFRLQMQLRLDHREARIADPCGARLCERGPRIVAGTAARRSPA